MLTLGYKASAEQFDARTLLEFGVRAEEAGFDSVVVSDHFQPWRYTDGHAPYSFTWMAALGQRTERVTIGSSVVTPTFRYHPAIVAQAIATLDSLTPGRILLGVGTGESMNEVPIGIEWPEFKERFARLREAVQLMRRLWTEEFVDFEGEYYRTHQATLFDRPPAAVPVYVAAGGPTVARYAGRAGDGMICTSGKGRELYADQLLPSLDEGATKADRDPAAIRRMIEVKVSFDPDPRRDPMGQTRHWAALSLSAEAKLGIEDPREMERLAAELPIEEVARRWLVSSDADEHVEQIAEYVDMGFDHLVFHAPGPDQARFIQVYGRLILPRLRRRFSMGAGNAAGATPPMAAGPEA